MSDDLSIEPRSLNVEGTGDPLWTILLEYQTTGLRRVMLIVCLWLLNEKVLQA